MSSSNPPRFTRQEVVLGGVGVALAAGFGGYGISRLFSGSNGTEVVLRPRAETIELGSRRAHTWTFGSGVPGPEIRVKQGERLRVRVENGLPEATTLHWHGVRVPNGMDGVPGMTQRAIAPGGSYVYDFVPPDAGTYWFHPHVGTQLDRGLYAPLVVEARHETLAYDREATLVLDDWLDGVAGTPDRGAAAPREERDGDGGDARRRRHVGHERDVGDGRHVGSERNRSERAR